MIERRALVIALGACAFVAPLAAHSQQATKPAHIGVLSSSSPETAGYLYDAFTRRMRELGYVEGKDVVYEFRWARGKVERMPELAQELVTLHPDVIFATGGLIGALAAQQATMSIPIVTINVSDPVASGLAKSLARPGGNVTGLSDLASETSQKRIEFLLAVVPKLSRVVVLWPSGDPLPVLLKSLETAAQRLGVEVVAMEASSPAELEAAFARMTREHVGAVIPIGISLAFHQRRQIADLALRHRMPTIFASHEAVEAGGLMSYGVNAADAFQRAAIYVDKILKGAKPADLPIEQATRVELVINLKTAKALGLTIPQSLRVRADQVVE